MIYLDVRILLGSFRFILAAILHRNLGYVYLLVMFWKAYLKDYTHSIQLVNEV